MNVSITMDKVYMNALIFFLKSQQSVDFTGIIQVLDIIDNETIREDDKRDLIYAVFHYFGLNEVGFKGGLFQPEDGAIEEFLQLWHFPSERREFHSPAGIIKILIPLN